MSRQTAIKCNPTLTKNESTDTPNSSAACVDTDDVSDYENDSFSRRKKSSSHADTLRDVTDQIGNDETLSTFSSDHVTTNEENLKKIQLDEELSETELEGEDRLNPPFDHIRKMRRTRNNETKRQGDQYLQNITASSANKKVQFDHSPHDVFVQLDELKGAGEEREWKETARWIKYEEDVEEGADRWGRPHVASLSFHSLLNLKRCLETGVVLMDLEEKDLQGVAIKVVEQMVVENLIHPDDQSLIVRALLLRHRHVNDNSHGSFRFGAKRENSICNSMQSFCCEDLECINLQHQNCLLRNSRRRSQLLSNILSNSSNDGNSRKNSLHTQPTSHSKFITQLLLTPPRRKSTMSEKDCNVSEERKRSIFSNELNGGQLFQRKGSGDAKIDMKDDSTFSSSQEELKRSHHDTILKRIPSNSEATTVLVGSVDFLEQPTIAFVRLAEGCLMPSITEVPIPVRFLFILLGPTNAGLDYHEVGRSIATLMSNTHFNNIAYKADDRKELLSAINDFLDDSIVLPPGKWAREQLLSFEELKAKSEMIRSRKKKKLEQRMKEKPFLTSEEEKKLLTAVDEDCKKQPRDPFEKTGRMFGGLINDLKRRLPMYKSDIADGLNTETLAATMFLYFAGLATAITFGGLVQSKTHNLIGISETLVSSCFVGIVFHALASQPLVFVGTSGPLILFDEALIQFCDSMHFSFLTVRLYIGIWLTIISLVVSAFEGSVYVRLFTRFTQETFSALITLIYIVETALKLVATYQRHPLYAEYKYKNTSELTSIGFQGTGEADKNISDVNMNVTNQISNSYLLSPRDNLGPINQPNTALFCTILTLGTFMLAYTLKIFRNSKFFGRNTRRALGDFGVPIAIAVFVLIDYTISGVYTDKLNVPEGVTPSDPSVRGWLIPSGPVPTWLPFLCLIPALLVYVLIFMETQISELIVGKSERGLKKGNGLHWDINLLCFCNTVCGFFGLPWHCAATVRSVTHVSAVTIMSTNHAPGDSPKIVDIKEQRLSGFFVALMVGLSIFASPILKKIPMSVLFGVFLYMGVCSMAGIQFFQRLRLFFMPVKHHPQVSFVRRVPSWKMHVFTSVQVFALAVLWAVKSSKLSLAFPFFLIMMVPIRKQMERIYSPLELRALDGSQPNDGAEDEPDFYEQASLPA